MTEVAGSPAAPEGRQPRPPTLLDAVLPVVVLIALTIVLFGIDATNGPLQVALLLSAATTSARSASPFRSDVS